MKTRKTTLALLLSLLINTSIFAQGRVVINEFMPWSGCSTTSEFIELLNFGPGPMNIGCYIISNGTYSVTIPPNTVLQPGQYFVLSGQNTLAQGCGNTDSLIHVDLNWTTCNCTNTAIPTTGNGFMVDGGSANEKVVLMDPNLNVIDAISRITPVSSSVAITTSTVSGGCTSKTFNLGTMGIGYETIGNSTGIDNSFARMVDGDCGWVKTTSISAHAPNKTGSTASTTYSFNTVSAADCQSTTGSVSIQVSAADVNALFPMNYTLAYDADGTGTFTNTDTYTYGVDNSAPNIDITNLAYGRYRITVGSSSSCNLKNFDFFIFNCYGVVLPVRLVYFKYLNTNNNQKIFGYKLEDATNVKEIVLEGSMGVAFEPVATHYIFTSDEMIIRSPLSSYTSYRLRLKDKSDKITYSEVVKINDETSTGIHYWPNPVIDKIYVELITNARTDASYTIFNTNGVSVKEDHLNLRSGNQIVSIPTNDLSKGVYHIRITGNGLNKTAQFQFIKQ